MSIAIKRLFVSLSVSAAFCGLVSASPASAGPSKVEAGKAEQAAPSKSADKPLSVKLVSVTSPVHAGDDATINVQTAPRSKCEISVKLKSGPSKAKGLEAKDANNTGKVSWTWKVAKNTAPGPIAVTVNCAWGEKKGSLDATIEVQK